MISDLPEISDNLFVHQIYTDFVKHNLRINTKINSGDPEEEYLSEERQK